MSAAHRQQVTVQSLSDDKSSQQLPMPSVLVAPIRPDIVTFVHSQMSKNRRQPYAVNEMAGMQHSAHSWGTGRAVSRIPRVSGGGTSRTGQGAFGNMCRKGRMFAPTKTWRKWHRRINQNQKRYAVASALAATAIPSLVLGRGHRIYNVPEVPLVVPDSVESLKKTKDAVAVLKQIGAYPDVQRALNSQKLRPGKGKMRNRRWVSRKGPLVVFNKDEGVVKAFRNIHGVELANVERLNLLQLAPGAHLGRFVIWTAGAFARLDEIWGTTTQESQAKKGYTLPRGMVTNSDISRIINSDEIQSVVRPAKTKIYRKRLKKNPLKNLGVMVRLNPHALSMRRSTLLFQETQRKQKEARVKAHAENSKKGKKKSKKYLRVAKAIKAHKKTQKATIARISQ